MGIQAKFAGDWPIMAQSPITGNHLLGTHDHAKGMANRVRKRAPSVANAAQPLVLVIDPDPVTLLGTAATLHGRGFEVHCSQAPEAAFKAARQLPLDLIIIDVDVEGSSGIEIVSAIHELPERGDVPAMFISAAQMPDVISRRFRNGSAFFLRRPFDPALFLDLVEKALWMPHLVKTHINRPHISIGAIAGFNTALAATATRSH